MTTERAMTLAEIRDRLINDGSPYWSPPNEHRCALMANAIDAHLRAEPVAYMSQFSLDALEECRHDDVNGSVGAWMRANEELCATIPVYLHPPAQAQDARENEMLRAELAREQAGRDRTCRILRSIYALLYPPVIQVDGTQMAFTPPAVNANKWMQELSDRIREIPDAIDDAKAREGYDGK